MTARDLLADGNLSGAVAAQLAHVARWPADPAARLFLAELLALAGDLPAARDELRLIDSPDPGWPGQRRRFVHVLKAEHARSVRGRRPAFPHPAPVHARARRRALLALQAGDPAAAERWIDRADEAAPHLLGHWNGREFDGLRDAGDRFAQVLEAFAGEHYVWLPLDQVRRVRLDPPAGVLDVAFRPARVTLVGGQELAVVVPLTYPGSAAAGDAFALGQDVDFPDRGGPACGVGAKVYMLGDEEVALADCRQLDVVASG
jgi:type VI secretion system protein ImpE